MLYDYGCDCGNKLLDVNHSANESPEYICSLCGAKMWKIMQPIHFSGGETAEASIWDGTTGRYINADEAVRRERAGDITMMTWDEQKREAKRKNDFNRENVKRKNDKKFIEKIANKGLV